MATSTWTSTLIPPSSTTGRAGSDPPGRPGQTVEEALGNVTALTDPAGGRAADFVSPDLRGTARTQTGLDARPGADLMRMQALFNGTVVAESDQTVMVEGNHYFRRVPLTGGLSPSGSRTLCPWKGLPECRSDACPSAWGSCARWRCPLRLLREPKVVGRGRGRAPPGGLGPGVEVGDDGAHGGLVLTTGSATGQSR